MRVVLCLFFLLAWAIRAEAADKVRVHFLDVGYADSILVEWLPGNAVLVDAGDAEDAPYILDYLKSAGVSDLTALIITHPHKNHFGAAQKVSERIRIGQIFINGDENAEEGYAELLDFFRGQKIPVINLRAGKKLPGMPEDLSWEILHPRELSDDVNGNSLVSLIRFGKTSILLTGDIMPSAQEAFLKENPELRNIDCVQIPHHGGPLHADFLSFFSKAGFIVSTGQNPWGLPDEQSLAKAAGKVFRTDIDGVIIAETDGEQVKVAAVKND